MTALDHDIWWSECCRCLQVRSAPTPALLQACLDECGRQNHPIKLDPDPVVRARADRPNCRLVRLDQPLRPHLGRRAHCACGAIAIIRHGWDGAREWMRWHRDDPDASPAVLATRAGWDEAK